LSDEVSVLLTEEAADKEMKYIWFMNYSNINAMNANFFIWGIFINYVD